MICRCTTPSLLKRPPPSLEWDRPLLLLPTLIVTGFDSSLFLFPSRERIENLLSTKQTSNSSAVCVAVDSRLDLAAHKVLWAGVGDALMILPSHLCRVHARSGHATSGMRLAMTFEMDWKGLELYVIFMPAGRVAWICSRWRHRSSERSGRPSLIRTRAVVVVADLRGR